ncbi:MoaD/ThiS family protein [Candidatus Chlorohelix sp.]|uniref:MoaD/ThiS family protein n=1 Tax=Candidatus Chlorohelix sp. TaxID=3139201 RepID=UPI003042D847
MSSKVTVKLFASFREIIGSGSLEFPVPANAGVTAGELLAQLVREYPALGGPARACRIMVNRQYADSSAALSPGDEVAFIPPVGGGSD